MTLGSEKNHFIVTANNGATSFQVPLVIGNTYDNYCMKTKALIGELGRLLKKVVRNHKTMIY
uniref:Uncharacterized protein n=1 Tax=Medicago truncatula TaxID=3880 RepID=A2Q667_MEDTR|nr:hypothetical protein MtrDRAFT_AC173289g16v1 [Medicago truncatula]